MARPQATTEDVKIEQRPDQVIPELGEPIDDGRQNVIKLPNGYTDKEWKAYQEKLAMAEDPILINVMMAGEGSQEATTTDFIGVNGKGVEVLNNGRWVSQGYLFMEQPVTIKRKYLEVMLRSKRDKIETVFYKLPDGKTINIAKKNTAGQYQIQILQDKNPKGIEWMQMIRAANF